MTVSLAAAERLVWVLLIAARAGVIWHLWSTGLAARYRWFFWLWVAGFGRSLLLFPFHPNSETYLNLWLLTEPFLWVLQALVVAEIYQLTLENFRGIYSLGRWFFVAAVVTAVLVSVMMLLPTWGKAGALFRIYFRVDRGLRFSLAVFLLMLLALVRFLPVPLRPNLRVHCGVYSFYFLSSTAAFLVESVFGAFVRTGVSTALMVIELACQMAWILLLRPGGEESQVPAPQLDKADSEAVFRRLYALNSALLRSGRR